MAKQKEDPAVLAAIGERIANARVIAGLTQLELGTEIKLDPQALSKVERGLHAAGSMTLLRIAQVLGVSADWILTGDESRGAPVPAYESLARFIIAQGITDPAELAYLHQQRFLGEPDDNTWMSCLATFRATRRNKNAPDRSEDLGKDSPDVMPLKAPRKPNQGAR